MGSAGQSTEEAFLSWAVGAPAAVAGGGFAWPKSALVTSGGEANSGTAIVAADASALAASDSGGGDAISGGSINHAAVPTAAATMIAAPTIRPGRVME